jgi:hypothetical protein
VPVLAPPSARSARPDGESGASAAGRLGIHSAVHRERRVSCRHERVCAPPVSERARHGQRPHARLSRVQGHDARSPAVRADAGARAGARAAGRSSTQRSRARTPLATSSPRAACFARAGHVEPVRALVRPSAAGGGAPCSTIPYARAYAKRPGDGVQERSRIGWSGDRARTI